MKDQFQREIEYMRISITDRCNLRCQYCMPLDGVKFLPMEEILTYEEIVRVCQSAAELGIRKIKITGGEPLVRKGVENLIGLINSIPGIEQVTLTTNGILLEEKIDALVKNGLCAVNISLDTLDKKEYAEITRFDKLDQVLKGLQACLRTGIHTKVNVVLRENCNWLQLISLAKDQPVSVRFIEMMPIGEGRSRNGLSAPDLIAGLKELYPDMEPDNTVHGNGPAEYYHIPGFRGSIGIIHAMHGKFCDKCNRIRMTSDGHLKPCLCYRDTIDIKDSLRNSTEEDVKELLKKAICAKPQAHVFEELMNITETKKMSSIGG